MQRSIPVLLTLFSLLPLSTLPAQTVHKIAEPFEHNLWEVTEESKAAGSAKASTDVAGENAASSKQSMDANASFAGTGFEFFAIQPKSPLVIPGSAKKLSVWVKGKPEGPGWSMTLRDGWGRSMNAKHKKYEWDLSKGRDGSWKKLTFPIPPDCTQPITITGLSTHNSGSVDKKCDTQILVDQLEIETDISDVDPASGELRSWVPDPAPEIKNPPKKSPSALLLAVELSATELHNVFSGSKPEFLLCVKNWLPEPATGSLEWKITDYLGKVLKSGTQPLAVESTFELPIPLDPPAFGLYQLESTATWKDGTKTVSATPVAYIPVPHELSEPEKDASPYGLNVLSGRAQMLSTFRKAGIVWYRDYAFGFELMKRAKGPSKGYTGWPWFPKIVKEFEKNGLRVLACMKGGIKPPGTFATSGTDSMQPNLEWKRDMAGLITDFPYITHYEVDNEYDLPSKKNVLKEVEIDWQNYRNYHKQFSELTKMMQSLSPGKLVAVENGRGGLFPQRVRACMESGDFDGIQVINSHHYTGDEPPETNFNEKNMGADKLDSGGLFFDQLREVKQVALSDGKKREHWLTEFGWDTKAGHVVSPLLQAAYLQRGFMMLQAAGTEKGFWFFDIDTEPARGYFDGCGLMTAAQLPKLSFCAFSALTQLLPKPEFVGMISAGDGTWGYMFRNEGKLVASLWTLEKEHGPSVTFDSAKLYDFLANPIARNTVELTQVPVYAVGVTEDSRWYQQTAYVLDSSYLISAAAGDTVTSTLRVNNNRKTPITAKVQLELPPEWKAEGEPQTISVEPGKTVLVPVKFRVNPKEPLGEKTVKFSISEEKPVVSIPLRVQLQAPFRLLVRSLRGEPGESDVSFRIDNHSWQMTDGAIRFKLPASWSAPSPEIKVEGLKPGEKREMHAKVKWAEGWKDTESAAVEFVSADGRSVQQPLIPSRTTIHRAPAGLKADGNLKDWPAKNQVPAWQLGCTMGNPNTKVYLGWSERGLHIALDVKDSKGVAKNPKFFWEGEVLEVFLDAQNKKEKPDRKFESGDHHFWLAPQFDNNRVFLGQWKHSDEIAETLYDIPGMESSVVKQKDGYILEAVIPASVIQKFTPKPGTRVGLNLNLRVQGTGDDREVYWTFSKLEDMGIHPEQWGSALLTE